MPLIRSRCTASYAGSPELWMRVARAIASVARYEEARRARYLTQRMAPPMAHGVGACAGGLRLRVAAWPWPLGIWPRAGTRRTPERERSERTLRREDVRVQMCTQ